MTYANDNAAIILQVGYTGGTIVHPSPVNVGVKVRDGIGGLI